MNAQATPILAQQALDRLATAPARKAYAQFAEHVTGGGPVAWESVESVSDEAIDAARRGAGGASLRRIMAAAGQRLDGASVEDIRQVLAVCSLIERDQSGAQPVKPEPKPEPKGPAIDPSAYVQREPEPSIESLVGPGAEPDAAAALADAIRRIAGAGSAPLDEGRVVELIRKHAAPAETVTRHVIEVHQPSGDPIVIDDAHPRTAPLIQALRAGQESGRRVNVLLVGPAGSGKTHAAGAAADALGVPFYAIGAVDDAFSILGFRDGRGEYQPTAFRNAWENGGAFLFDEMDGSSPEALLVVNQALASDRMAFPDGMVARHPDFYCVAAANTYGSGADRVYVGRNQLDAATLDRFVTMSFEYDEALERKLTGADSDPVAGAWVRYVQRVRAVAEKQRARLVISMRASMAGVDLLRAGWTVAEVLDSALWKGAPADTRHAIEAEAGTLETVNGGE
jgi:MoxR-like ATPase